MAKNTKALTEAERNWIINAILDDFLLGGGRTISKLCKQYGLSPGVFYASVPMKSEWRDKLNLGRIVSSHNSMDAILDIGNNDKMDCPKSAAVKFNALKFAASRLNPHEYGESSILHLNDMRAEETPEVGQLLTNLVDLFSTVAQFSEDENRKLLENGGKGDVIDGEFRDLFSTDDD